MAILISQKNASSTTSSVASLTAYNFQASAALSSSINQFFGLSEVKETLTYNGGSLKVADVSNGDILNITDIAHADTLVLSLSGNNVIITDSTATKTYTLGAFIPSETVTVTFGEGEVGAKSISIVNTGGTYTYGYAGQANTTNPFSGGTLTLDTTAPTTPTLTTVSLPNTSTVTVTSSTDAAKIYLVNSTLSVTSQATNLATLETTYSTKVKSTTGSGATDTSAALTGLVDGIYSAYAVDTAGNWTVASTNKVTVDTTAPLLTNAVANTITGITVGGGSLPADGATGVLVGSNIILSFSENIVVGTGNITITDGSTPQTIDVTDATQVTVSGSTMTINPTSDLIGGGAYYVQIAATAIKDAATNAYAGIADTTTLNFTAAANGTIVAPVLIATSGDDVINGNQGGATSVSPIAFTATGSDKFVISDTSNAKISIDTFAAGDQLIFHISSAYGADPATTFSASSFATALSVSAITGTSVKLINNYDGAVQEITLPNASTAVTDDTLAEVLTLTGGSVAYVIDGSASADTIIGGAGADTITGGAGSDAITAGAGADIIDGGTDNDNYIYSTVTGDTSVAGGTSGAISTAALDVITVTAGDTIDLTASLGTDASYSTVTAAAAASNTLTVTTSTVVEVRGTYVGSTINTFTPSDTGTDVMLSWASADGTTADQSIVLVGTGAVADTIAAGILTIA